MSASSESMEAEEQLEMKPNRQHIITCSGDASLRLWNLESGTQIGNNWQDDGDEEGVVAIALSPNSKMVASGSTSGMVKLWDAETGTVTMKWTRHTDDINSVRWSADGRCVTSGSYDGTITVWEVGSGETVLGPIKTGNEWVNTVAYSPDSSNIATGGSNAIETWDTTTGERLSTLEQDFQVSSLAWTSDQKKLIAGFENGWIRIFNTTTWGQVAILECHAYGVNALSLFQNDRLLASASTDGTARLWNLDTNLPVGPPLQHPHWVWDAALSADGKFLVTACLDHNAYVWDTHTILKDSGFQDLLSVPNTANRDAHLQVAGGKLILDSDATGQPEKPAIPCSTPPTLFEDARDSVHTPNIPPATPPADIAPSVVHGDLPASTTHIGSPPTHRHRRNIFSTFSVSGTLLLLHRVSPHSRRNIHSSMNLPEQRSCPPPISVHEPVDVRIPEAMDNESDATRRPSHDERHLRSIVDVQDRNRLPITCTHPPSSLNSYHHSISPSSTSSERPLLGRILGCFRGSHSEYDTWWARCICRASTQQEDVKEDGNSVTVDNV